jgi:hypothetical protein
MTTAITYIDFVPSAITAPQFQVQLDGNTYNVVLTVNLSGQRYYVSIYQLDGTLVVCQPLYGSPVGIPILSSSWANGTVSIVTGVANHGLAKNSTVNLTISGMSPDAYNGQYECFVTSRIGFSYDLSADPGQSVMQGSANQNFSLTQGYFTDQLIYRQANSQFEVWSSS